MTNYLSSYSSKSKSWKWKIFFLKITFKLHFYFNHVFKKKKTLFHLFYRYTKHKTYEKNLSKRVLSAQLLKRQDKNNVFSSLDRNNLINFFFVYLVPTIVIFISKSHCTYIFFLHFPSSVFILIKTKCMCVPILLCHGFILSLNLWTVNNCE